MYIVSYVIHVLLLTRLHGGVRNMLIAQGLLLQGAMLRIQACGLRVGKV